MKRSALNVIPRLVSLAGVVMLGAAGSVRAAAGAAAAAAAVGAPAAVPFAAPAHDALPGPAGGLLRVLLALVLVVAAIFAAAWVSRRARGAVGARSSNLDVLAQLPLGPRERAVLIRVGERQLLIGVTNGCIRTLHVLDPASIQADGTDTAAPGAGAPQRPSFKALLLKSLGK
jgi:flagellar protein FliO/FliZ